MFFTKREMACKCGCGLVIENLTLLDMLNNARGEAGVPFNINSWCRCESHNQKVGGSDASSHLTGEGVDIRANNDNDRHTILTALIRAGFNRIGIARTFIHVDISPCKNKNRIWIYR